MLDPVAIEAERTPVNGSQRRFSMRIGFILQLDIHISWSVSVD